VAAAERHKVKARGAAGTESFAAAVPARWRPTKDHQWGDRADDHPATRAKLQNIIVT
jgi:hypothetical protein